ncbi:MAG TPA: GNAT family N-acetyltransferase [Patescibacteria group bacterium]|nr:GNAT family N-acetyltransferase [Patescibacteria group bacterium]
MDSPNYDISRSIALLTQGAPVSVADPAPGDALPAAREPAPGRISVVPVEETAQLAQWVPEWEQLAASALEPNVFYEPWQILPAIEAFGNRSRLIHLLVFSQDPAAPAARPLLCAYFPFERLRRFQGVPVSVLTLWKHIHCFLCTPLIRPGYAMPSLTALMEWACADPRGAAIVQFPQVAADGPFKKALDEFRRHWSHPSFAFGKYDRALFVPRADADEYLLAAVSPKSRKQLRRLTRRLSEEGNVEVTELGSNGDLEAWVESFLELEASGWKGRADSALACHDSERKFFKTMTHEAFRRGRLMMLALKLDGRPIAMKCNLLTGRASFSFKIAFDETFAHFSPGMLLEIENIRRLHSASGLEWMDSCAVSNHSMANRLWIDRRTIQSLAIASGRPMGKLLVKALPTVSRLARRFVWPGRAEIVKTSPGGEP